MVTTEIQQRLQEPELSRHAERYFDQQLAFLALLDDELLASMGPLPFESGNAIARAIALRRSLRFNGAAPFRERNGVP
jgi:hypothetical protein